VLYTKAERNAMNGALRRSVARAGGRYRPINEFEFEQLSRIVELCPINVAPGDAARVERLHGRYAKLMLKHSQPPQRAAIAWLLDGLRDDLPKPLKLSGQKMPQAVDVW
jgi:hypothetical protein